jgi:anthranilate synthase component I
MSISPDFDAFARVYDSGKPQLVSTKLVADLETPVSAYLKLADGRANSFLLESVEGGSVRGRYSIIGFKPDVIWRCRKGQAEINRRARSDGQAFEKLDGRPLETLRQLIRECQMDLPPGLPPMASGLFGFLGYDMVRDMERLPDKNPDPIGLPDAIMVRPTIICIFDRLEDNVTLVTPAFPTDGTSARAAYEAAQERLADAVSDFERALPFRRDSASELDELPEPQANMSKEDFKKMVATCKEYIRAGDAFQIVLSQRAERPTSASATELYRALRRVNPSPYLFLLELGGLALVGSSPETLVKADGRRASLNPIAGTTQPGPGDAQRLLESEKDRAEHVMLVDLGRNDLSRVCRHGTVRVERFMEPERFSHVTHLVSEVVGELRDDVRPFDLLRACFPAGTVSGAPKVRAMEIIDELEKEKRGLYAGCVGYFSADGEMDTCIALRTALIKDGTIYVQAGAGIVADSNPAAEQQECVNKAKALFRAAEEARRFASAAKRGQ